MDLEADVFVPPTHGNNPKFESKKKLILQNKGNNS